MTPANRIEITLSDEKLAELDRARGLVPRATFVKHLIDVGLAGPPLEAKGESDWATWWRGGAKAAEPKGLGKGPTAPVPKGGKKR
jgi:hypothetical protein